MLKNGPDGQWSMGNGKDVAVFPLPIAIARQAGLFQRPAVTGGLAVGGAASNSLGADMTWNVWAGGDRQPCVN
jgi:hypothetical protein